MNNTFFGPRSPWLTHPLLTETRTRTEIDRVLTWAPSAVDVVDIGCGFGRHSIEVARRGLAVNGIDPSTTMIDEARRGAAAAGVEVEFSVDVGQSPLATASVDLAMCLFTTLGQDPMDGRSPQAIANAVLANVATALRPGGVMVIEVPDRARLEPTLMTQEVLGETRVTRSLDPETGVVRERFEAPDDTFDLGYVVFTMAELSAMVEHAGLEVVEHLPTALMPPPPNFQTLVARCPSR